MVCRAMSFATPPAATGTAAPATRAADRTSRLRSALLLAAALLACMGSPALAADGDATDAPPTPSLFMWGPQDVGLGLGYADGFQVAHSIYEEGDDVSALLILPHWQVTLTRQPIEPRWYKGRLQFRAEATMMANFSPRNGFAGGLALLLRYSWNTGGRIRPWFQIGAGFLGLDLDIESDQVDGFAFQPQGGVGVVWMLGGGHAIDVGVRYQHISNAFTKRPNGGIDTMQYTIGYAYYFDD